MLKILILSLITLNTIAYADTKLSISGSLLYSSPEVKDSSAFDGIEEKSELGFGAGLRALMGINDQLYFRSGAGLVQKNFSYEADSTITGKGNFEQSFLYLNIPLTLYWKASPQVGLFGGTAINAKISDDCDASGDYDSCTNENEKTLVFPAIIGFDFSFSEKMSMEISYEYGATETAKNLKTHSAVAGFLYHLD